MAETSNPANCAAALPETRPDPYRDTPLGVEAAWCPDGIGLPPFAAAAEAPARFLAQAFLRRIA